MNKLYSIIFCLSIVACGSQETEKKTNEVPKPAPPVESEKPDNPSPPNLPFPIPCDSIPFPFPGCPSNDKPAPIPTPDQGNVVEKEQFLRFHNLKRCWHDAPDIVWSDKLADEARQYASKCVFAHDPSNMGRWGENLAIGYGSIVASQDAWYMEFLKYNFTLGQFSPATGHFTQMVWQGSKELGCARVQCPQGAYDICRYSPPGNVIGQFRGNVKPLKSDISQCGI